MIGSPELEAHCIPLTTLIIPEAPGDYAIAATAIPELPEPDTFTIPGDQVRRLVTFLTPNQTRLLQNFDDSDFTHLPPRSYVRWKTLYRRLKDMRNTTNY